MSKYGCRLFLAPAAIFNPHAFQANISLSLLYLAEHCVYSLLRAYIALVQVRGVEMSQNFTQATSAIGGVLDADEYVVLTKRNLEDGFELRLRMSKDKDGYTTMALRAGALLEAVMFVAPPELIEVRPVVDLGDDCDDGGDDGDDPNVSPDSPGGILSSILKKT
jgi:hypothetical protein